MNNNASRIFAALLSGRPELMTCERSISQAFDIMADCFRSDAMLLVCGNGGSASDSEHIVGELMKSFLLKRPLDRASRESVVDVDKQYGEGIATQLQGAMRAISLVSQASLISAISNDMSWDMAFAQQVFAYGRRGDVLLAISTSGNAKNVCNAALVARALGMSVVGLTGESGGRLRNYCDASICVPSGETYQIQEYHQPVYHALCAMLEVELFSS